MKMSIQKTSKINSIQISSEGDINIKNIVELVQLDISIIFGNITATSFHLLAHSFLDNIARSQAHWLPS